MQNSNSMLPISQQLVLVTGGGRGLGEQLVRSFLREGACVVINYLNSADQARELAAMLRKRRLPCRPT